MNKRKDKGTLLTKEEIEYIVANKELGYKFVRDHGVSYWGFRMWLQKQHNEKMKDIKGFEDLYVRYYKRFMYHKKSFRNKYGVSISTVRDWIYRTYGLLMSEVDNLPVYVREYKNWKRRKRQCLD